MIAHDGLVSPAATLSDLRRAGLSQEATTLILFAPGAQAVRVGQKLALNISGRIQSTFPNWNISTEIVSASPTETILNVSDWWRPDLLIIDSDAYVRERSRLSSVSLEVAHRARSSVRLVRARGASIKPLRLIVGNGGSRACQAVMKEVARRHWPANKETHVVSVNEESGVKAAEELLAASQRLGADAIFIGPRRERAVGRLLLGSVATQIVTRARCTVEIVRAPQ